MHPPARAGNSVIGRKGLSLSFRGGHNQPVQFRLNPDLAGQTGIGPHIEGEIEHVFFHALRRGQAVLPGRINIDMACRTGTGPTALSLNPGDGIANRGFHQSGPILGRHRTRGALRINKSDCGHANAHKANDGVHLEHLRQEGSPSLGFGLAEALRKTVAAQAADHG